MGWAVLDNNVISLYMHTHSIWSIYCTTLCEKLLYWSIQKYSDVRSLDFFHLICRNCLSPNNSRPSLLYVHSPKTVDSTFIVNALAVFPISQMVFYQKRHYVWGADTFSIAFRLVHVYPPHPRKMSTANSYVLNAQKVTCCRLQRKAAKPGRLFAFSWYCSWRGVTAHLHKRL